MTNETTTAPTRTTPTRANASLLVALLDAVNGHIKTIINKEITAALQNTTTLALMDEKLEEKIREIAKEEIDGHGREEYHPSDDYINDLISNYLNSSDYVKEWQLKEKINDALGDSEFVTSDDLDDKLCGYVPEDEIEDKIKEALENITLNVSINTKEIF